MLSQRERTMPGSAVRKTGPMAYRYCGPHVNAQYYLDHQPVNPISKVIVDIGIECFFSNGGICNPLHKEKNCPFLV